MELSVVIPFYNEEDNIYLLIDEVTTTLTGKYDFEIVTVDDGSTDSTWERLCLKAVENNRVRPIRHLNNYGQSTALWTGVRFARAELVATLDGDGQNDPQNIPELVEIYKNQTKPAQLLLIAGHRHQRQDSFVKKVSSLIANSIRAGLLKDRTVDTGCGLKVFFRQTYLSLPFFDHMHRFLPALFIRAGGEVVSAPVNHRPRLHGLSKYGVWNRLWVGLVDLLGVIWLQKRMVNPLISEGDKIER